MNLVSPTFGQLTLFDLQVQVHQQFDPEGRIVGFLRGVRISLKEVSMVHVDCLHVDFPSTPQISSILPGPSNRWFLHTS